MLFHFFELRALAKARNAKAKAFDEATAEVTRLGVEVRRVAEPLGILQEFDPLWGTTAGFLADDMRSLFAQDYSADRADALRAFDATWVALKNRECAALAMYDHAIQTEKDLVRSARRLWDMPVVIGAVSFAYWLGSLVHFPLPGAMIGAALATISRVYAQTDDERAAEKSIAAWSEKRAEVAAGLSPLYGPPSAHWHLL